MRFLGAPAGYEFMSLIEAVILAGTNDSRLDPESRALIAANVTAPLDIQVFVTPTCPHCPRAVTLAHRMAVESPLIRASCVEATEFMDLSRKFRVTGVPKTVVNESIEILGALPEEHVRAGCARIAGNGFAAERVAQFVFAGAGPASIVAVLTKSSFGYSASR